MVKKILYLLRVLATKTPLNFGLYNFIASKLGIP